MRIFQLCAIALAVAALGGCATQKQVAQMEGRGQSQLYDSPFGEVWSAAVDAAQIGDLQIRAADRTRGYIAAGRGMRLATHGENVGIWVRPLGPQQTEVEIVSRQAGPPKLWFKNWEDEIHNSIAANLTRDYGRERTISEPAGASTDRGDSLLMDPVPVSPPPPVYQQAP